MRHILFLTILGFSFAVFSQPFNSENPSGKEIIAPVLIKGAENDQAYAGVFTTEPTAQPPNALTILRQELNRQAQLDQQEAHKDGVFKSVNKRFTPESITFFIAVGGVTFNSMWIKSHGDPLAMERHILSLKDPIAQLSFYAFMQSQGFYMDFHTKKLGINTMDAVTRRQMMTALSYKGMAVGSLAASIVADLGQSLKMCVDEWVHGKTDELSLESCNQAWKQWTLRGKFTQYFPQIISLWAAQASSAFIENIPKNSASIFNRIAPAASDKIKKFTEKILTKDTLVKAVYKISGADVALTFTGGAWITKSIKWAGKLTKFSVFVTADHFLSNYTYRPLNNLIRPLFFDFDAMALNNLWHEADLANWDQVKIKNPKSLESFEKEIENYGAQMQQWREHLNADAEADLAGWMEMTKKLLNQMDYAYKYYHGFVGFLFQSLKTDYQTKKNQLNNQLAPSAAMPQYPLRTLPFYGVSAGPYKALGGPIEDYYLLNPNELEKRQKEHILNTAQKYKLRTPPLKGIELKEFNTILEKLLSHDNARMASGLNDLNKMNITETMYVSTTATYEDISGYSSEFQDAVYELKKELGNPQPVVYPFAGYSQAFTAYGANRITAEGADYSKWSVLNRYNFNKEADLMLYKIICGPTTGQLKKTGLAGVSILSPQFDPPSLLKYNRDREEFCKSTRMTNDLYSTNIANKKLSNYVLENLNYEIFSDYKDKNKTADFENWWLKNASEPINEEFKNFDRQYKKLVELAADNYFDRRSKFKLLADGLNQSKYLPKSINASLRAESRLYLQILSRALTTEKLTPAGRQYNYLEFATLSSEKNNYTPLYQQAPREIERLNDLLNGYSALIVQDQVDFDSYIAHSKKIDTAINDILVLANLKKVAPTPDSERAEDLSASIAAATTGTENTDKVYEDIPVQTHTYKQRMTIAAVKGLRQVESEIRRFIRMKILLSQTLELDTHEFKKDWNSANPTVLNSSKPKKISPLNPK